MAPQRVKSPYEDLYRLHPITWAPEVKERLYALPEVKALVDTELTPEQWSELRVGFWSHIPFYDEHQRAVLFPEWYKYALTGEAKPRQTSQGDNWQVYDEAYQQALEKFHELTKDIPPEFADESLLEKYYGEYMEQYIGEKTTGEPYGDTGLDESQMRMIIHEISHYADHLKRGEQFVTETTTYFRDKEKTEIDYDKYFNTPAEQMSFKAEIRYMRARGVPEADLVHKMLMMYGGEPEFWTRMVAETLEKQASMTRSARWSIWDKDEQDYFRAGRNSDTEMQAIIKAVDYLYRGTEWEESISVLPVDDKKRILKQQNLEPREHGWQDAPEKVDEEITRWEERWHRRAELRKKAEPVCPRCEVDYANSGVGEQEYEREHIGLHGMCSGCLGEQRETTLRVQPQPKFELGEEVVTVSDGNFPISSPIVLYGDTNDLPDRTGEYYNLPVGTKAYIEDRAYNASYGIWVYIITIGLSYGASVLLLEVQEDSLKPTKEKEDDIRTWEERWHRRAQANKYFRIRFNVGSGVFRGHSLEEAKTTAVTWALQHATEEGEPITVLDISETDSREYNQHQRELGEARKRRQEKDQVEVRDWEERWHRRASMRKKAWIINTLQEFEDSLVPQIYDIFYITLDGAIVSMDYVKENVEYFRNALREKEKVGGIGMSHEDRQWVVTDAEVNWEDPDLHCDMTGELIPPQYPPDEPEPEGKDEAIQQWEERWHRRASLRKKAEFSAYNTSTTMQFWLESGQNAPTLRQCVDDAYEGMLEGMDFTDADMDAMLDTTFEQRWAYLEEWDIHIYRQRIETEDAIPIPGLRIAVPDSVKELNKVPGEEKDVQEWEERWHRRGSMHKQAQFTAGVGIVVIKGILGGLPIYEIVEDTEEEINVPEGTKGIIRGRTEINDLWEVDITTGIYAGEMVEIYEENMDIDPNPEPDKEIAKEQERDVRDWEERWHRRASMTRKAVKEEEKPAVDHKKYVQSLLDANEKYEAVQYILANNLEGYNLQELTAGFGGIEIASLVKDYGVDYRNILSEETIQQIASDIKMVKFYIMRHAYSGDDLSKFLEGDIYQNISEVAKIFGIDMGKYVDDAKKYVEEHTGYQFRYPSHPQQKTQAEVKKLRDIGITDTDHREFPYKITNLSREWGLKSQERVRGAFPFSFGIESTDDIFPEDAFHTLNPHGVPGKKPVGFVYGTYIPGKVLYVDEMQSDLVQRAQFYFTSYEKARQKVVDRMEKNKALPQTEEIVKRTSKDRDLLSKIDGNRGSFHPEFDNIHSRIQNYFSGWNIVAMNIVLNFAREHHIPVIYVASANIIANKWTHRETAVDLYKRMYDDMLQEKYGAVKDGDWWKIEMKDVMEKIARMTRKATWVAYHKDDPDEKMESNRLDELLDLLWEDWWEGTDWDSDEEKQYFMDFATEDKRDFLESHDWVFEEATGQEESGEVTEWEERWHRRASITKTAFWSVWDRQTQQFMNSGRNSATLEEAVDAMVDYLAGEPDSEEDWDRVRQQSLQERQNLVEGYEFEFQEHTQRQVEPGDPTDLPNETYYSFPDAGRDGRRIKRDFMGFLEWFDADKRGVVSLDLEGQLHWKFSISSGDVEAVYDEDGNELVHAEPRKLPKQYTQAVRNWIKANKATLPNWTAILKDFKEYHPRNVATPAGTIKGYYDTWTENPYDPCVDVIVEVDVASMLFTKMDYQEIVGDIFGGWDTIDANKYASYETVHLARQKSEQDARTLLTTMLDSMMQQSHFTLEKLQERLGASVDDSEVREWEERWHRRGSLRKKAGLAVGDTVRIRNDGYYNKTYWQRPMAVVGVEPEPYLKASAEVKYLRGGTSGTVSALIPTPTNPADDMYAVAIEYEFMPNLTVHGIFAFYERDLENTDQPSSETRDWEERWHRRAGLRKKALQDEWRCEFEDVGQGHYFTTDTDAYEWALEKSKERPEKVILIEKFRPQRYKIYRVQNGLLIEDFARTRQKEDTQDVREWEERWHRRGSLRKQSWGAPTINRSRLEKVLLSPENEDGYEKGTRNVYYNKYNGIFKVRFYATDVVEADTRTKKITKVTDGGYYNNATHSTIWQAINILRQNGYSEPDLVAGYEYDATWTKSDKEVVEAKSHRTESERLAELAKSKNDDVRLAVANNSTTPASVLESLLNDSDPEVIKAAIGNSNASVRMLLKRIESGNIQDKISIAGRTHSKRILSILVRDPLPYVRMALAVRSRLPIEFKEILAEDRSDGVRATVGENASYTDGTIITKLLGDPVAGVVARIVRNNRTIPSDVLEPLVNSSHALVREALAASYRVTEDMLRKLSTDTDVSVRKTVASNYQIPEDAQVTLALDPDESVKVTLLENNSVSERALRMLRQDGNREIAQKAREKLGEQPPTTEETEIQDWEERWHKRSSLTKQARWIVLDEGETLGGYTTLEEAVENQWAIYWHGSGADQDDAQVEERERTSLEDKRGFLENHGKEFVELRDFEVGEIVGVRTEGTYPTGPMGSIMVHLVAGKRAEVTYRSDSGEFYHIKVLEGAGEGYEFEFLAEDLDPLPGRPRFTSETEEPGEDVQRWEERWHRRASLRKKALWLSWDTERDELYGEYETEKEAVDDMFKMTWIVANQDEHPEVRDEVVEYGIREFSLEEKKAFLKTVNFEIINPDADVQQWEERWHRRANLTTPEVGDVVGFKYNFTADSPDTVEKIFVQVDLYGEITETANQRGYFTVELLTGEDAGMGIYVHSSYLEVVHSDKLDEVHEWEERWHRRASSFAQVWVSPDGEEYKAPTGHYDWIFKNAKTLQGYGIDTREALLKHKNSPESVIQVLLQAGWVRQSDNGYFEVWDVTSYGTQEILEKMLTKYPSTKVAIDYHLPKEDFVDFFSADALEEGMSRTINLAIRLKSMTFGLKGRTVTAGVSRDLASDATATPEQLMELAKDPYRKIRWYVARNPAVPIEVLQMLAKDEDEHVRGEVAQNPKTPPELLQSLSDEESFNVLSGIAQNPKVPVELLWKLSKHDNEAINWSILNSPNVTTELVDALAKSKGEMTRMLVERMQKERGEVKTAGDYGYTSAWITPDGKVIEGIYCHSDWVDDNWDKLEAYGLDLAKFVDAEDADIINDELVRLGFTRITRVYGDSPDRPIVMADVNRLPLDEIVKEYIEQHKPKHVGIQTMNPPEYKSMPYEEYLEKYASATGMVRQADLKGQETTLPAGTKLFRCTNEQYDQDQEVELRDTYFFIGGYGGCGVAQSRSYAYEFELLEDVPAITFDTWEATVSPFRDKYTDRAIIGYHSDSKERGDVYFPIPVKVKVVSMKPVSEVYKRKTTGMVRQAHISEKDLRNIKKLYESYVQGIKDEDLLAEGKMSMLEVTDAVIERLDQEAGEIYDMTAVNIGKRREGIKICEDMMKNLMKQRDVVLSARTFDETIIAIDTLLSIYHKDAQMINKMMEYAYDTDLVGEIEKLKGLAEDLFGGGETKTAGLEEYKHKRDFGKTPEPEGTVTETSDKPIWVLQRHQAEKAGLHGDFRLEDEGVMKSFVIRKVDEFLAGDVNRVMVINTEDHPIEYAGFEGDIPSGEYGGGHMDIADSGTFETLDKTDSKWTVQLTGDVLDGIFTLVKAPAKYGKDKWFLSRAVGTEKESGLFLQKHFTTNA